MKYLLDTNAIILAADGRNELLRQRMANSDEGDIVTSAIAYAEVALGTELGKPPNRDLLMVFFAEVSVLPFDAAAADSYARLGFTRASYDRLIAAHALSLGLTLVSANVGDFTDVKGLKVENWAGQ